MNKLGRNTWIGLGVGTAAGISLVLFLVIFKKMKRRLCQSLTVPSNSDASLLDTDGESLTTVSHALEVQGLHQLCPSNRCYAQPEMKADSSIEALAVRPRRALLLEQQVELKNKLDDVLRCVAGLRTEVGSLRDDLRDVAAQIVQDVKKDLEESQRVARRRRLPPRERINSASSSSVYFTATSHQDGEDEAGYSTANGESDFYGESEQETKKDVEDEEEEDGEDEDEDEFVEEEEEEEEEDESHLTECTLKQDSSEAETEEESFSDAESPGDLEVPPPTPNNAVASGGAQDDGQGPKPCSPSRGLDEKAPAQKTRGQ